MKLKKKRSESDTVTQTRNLSFAYNPYKFVRTHTHTHTHTIGAIGFLVQGNRHFLPVLRIEPASETSESLTIRPRLLECLCLWNFICSMNINPHAGGKNRPLPWVESRHKHSYTHDHELHQ